MSMRKKKYEKKRTSSKPDSPREHSSFQWSFSEEGSRRPSLQSTSQYSDDYDLSHSDQSYTSMSRKHQSRSNTTDEDDYLSDNKYSENYSEEEKSRKAKVIKSEAQRISSKPKGQKFSRQHNSASVPGRTKLLPKRGGTQTSKGFLTAHLQAMIVNFESLQKQKVLALKNKIKELQFVSATLKEENKTLKQAKKQNDRDMTEITSMVVYHENSVKELRSKVRETELNITSTESKTRKQNAIMVRLNDKSKEYQDLLYNEKLEEQEVLEEKVETKEQEVIDKDKRIADLELKLLSIKKKMQTETRKEQARYQDIKKSINIKREECQSIRTQILNKSKEIHRKNIYSRCSKKPTTFPAIGWYPGEDDEQPPNEKVQNWLRAIQHTEDTHVEYTTNK